MATDLSESRRVESPSNSLTTQTAFLSRIPVSRAAGSLTSSCITFRIGDGDYRVTRLQPDAAVARRAFRLQKKGGDEAVYDVYLDQFGPHCECLGYLRWSKPCKHIRALRQAGLI